MAQISNEFNVDLNVDELITSTENIEKYNKILETEIDNITQICTELLTVWSSDSADITSSIDKINECTAKIKEVINKYSQYDFIICCQYRLSLSGCQ